MLKRLTLFFTLAFLPAVAPAEHFVSTSLPQFETYISEVLNKTSVPGTAVAIVKDGRVIYARGFGVRDREAGLPVSENTLFAIGSTTKAMTATGIALLVDEGRLDFRKPVAEYLPDFRLKDATASREANLVDLLAHRTGVPRHDLAWYGNDGFARSYFWERLKYLEPSASLRDIWQYNNFMYMAAGHIIERTASESWEEFTRRRIFAPLGMTHSNFKVEDTEASADFARPYSMRAGSLRRVPMRPIIGMGPAGSVNSNVLDMAKWLQFNIDGGKAGGTPLLKPEVLSFVHRPHMILPGPALPFSEFTAPAYALGWIRQHYRGNDLLWHTGGIDGFLTFVAFMPAQKLGVVVFQNSDHDQIMLPLGLRAIDEILQSPVTDWLERFRALPKPAPIQKEYARGPLPRPLKDYAGVYTHPAYGSATLAESGGSLVMTFHGMTFPLEHLNNGIFRLSSLEIPDVSAMEPVYFRINGEGQIGELMMKLEESVAAIAFTREP